MPAQTFFVFAKILDPIGPLHRGEKYEDPLQELLDAEGLGEITGAERCKAAKAIFFTLALISS